MRLFNVSNTTISPAAIQTGLMAQQCALQLQSYIGSDAQRAKWLSDLDRVDHFIKTPPHSILSMLGLGCWNVWRASRILRQVEAQTSAAGLLVPDLQSGLVVNAARFREHAILPEPQQDSALCVINRGSVREAHPHEIAEHVVGQFVRSKHRAHKTLLAILERSFDAHIIRLDSQVASIDRIIHMQEIPDDASYPRYFEHANIELIRTLQATLAELNDGVDIPWYGCERAIMSYAIGYRLEQEGIDAETASVAESRRGLSIALQIPEYSSFQLICLLMQIRNDSIDNALVEQLRCAREGRTIDLEQAISAGVRCNDILKASELVGNIDIIHANIYTAYELAKREDPHTDPSIVLCRLRAAVARLGKATGSSRREYDDAIETLREIEANPNYGTVVSLFDR